MTISARGGAQAHIESQSVRILLGDLSEHNNVDGLSNLMKKNNSSYLNSSNANNKSNADNSVFIKQISNNTGTELKIWYTNATSLNNKIDELRLLICIHRPDLVCVAETWFKNESDVQVDDYNLYRKDRAYHGGGVCIYVKKDIISVESDVEELNNSEIEQIWTCLRIGKQNVLVGCLYRPPCTTPAVNSVIIESIKAAKRAVYKKKYSDIVITGDFNYNTIDWSDPEIPFSPGDRKTQTNSFINCLDECFLTQCVSEPTFQKANHQSYNILDLVITNDRNRINSINHADPLGESNQGHHLLRINYILSDPKLAFKESKAFTLYEKGDYERFSQYIDGVEWEAEFLNKLINECYDIFLYHYYNATEEFIPKFTNPKNKD